MKIFKSEAGVVLFRASPVHYRSLLSAKNSVSESSHPGTVTTAWVTSGKPFSPDFLPSERILPGNLNSPSLSLVSGQKGIVRVNWHAAASDSCYRLWDRCCKSLLTFFQKIRKIRSFFYLPCRWNLKPLWSWPGFLWILKRSHWELWQAGQNPHIELHWGGQSSTFLFLKAN